MKGAKVQLYESDTAKARLNHSAWYFEPVPYKRLAWLLDHMLNHEREDEREVRVTALLAGEVVCTNLSAFKLVWLDDGEKGEDLP